MGSRWSSTLIATLAASATVLARRVAVYVAHRCRLVGLVSME